MDKSTLFFIVVQSIVTGIVIALTVRDGGTGIGVLFMFAVLAMLIRSFLYEDEARNRKR